MASERSFPLRTVALRAPWVSSRLPWRSRSPSLARLCPAARPSRLRQQRRPPSQRSRPAPDDSTESMFPHFKNTRFWLSGQANFIFQTHPDFHALYSGTHSLSPHYEKATSRVLTLYTGVRLNNSTEFLVDLEEAGGAALSQGFGLAGNPESRHRPQSAAQQSALSRPRHVPHTCSRSATTKSRTSATSSPSSTNSRAAASNSASANSACRISSTSTPSAPTPTSNSSTGPSTTTAPGTTPPTPAATPSALTADFEDRNWGFRFAEALMPKVANGIDLVWKPWQVHAENFEYELRHGIDPEEVGRRPPARLHQLRQHGHLPRSGHQGRRSRHHARHHRATPGTSRASTDSASTSSRISRTTSPPSRASVGTTARPNPSPTPKSIKRSIRALGANGAWWHRKQDRAGIAFVSNAIKKDHQNYLAAGGLGFLLGDGHLNYGRENILETYYTVHVWRGIYLAPGLQHIVNPGYNRDRGPVLVPSFRAHVEF